MDPEEISKAFWHACSGAQRRTAEYLLARRADLNWVPDYADGTPLDAASGSGTRRENVITWLRELGARSSGPNSQPWVPVGVAVEDVRVVVVMLLQAPGTASGCPRPWSGTWATGPAAHPDRTKRPPDRHPSQLSQVSPQSRLSGYPSALYDPNQPTRDVQWR
jgi:hypothetical protein